MSENLLPLAIRAIDELEYIYQLQQLLHISLEQLDSVSLPIDSMPSKFIDRAGLLISVYLFQVEQRFERLKLNLETIKNCELIGVGKSKS